MKPQNYSNHRRYVPLYHQILGPLLIVGLIVSAYNTYKLIGDNSFFTACLINLLFVCGLLLSYFVRVFSLKAQDRAIRAEENFRSYIVTGKPLDYRLNLRQILALRFAPDEELAELSERTVTENLSANDIKQVIKNWRADNHRV